MLADVLFYNRSGRQWEVTTGRDEQTNERKLEIFPAGDMGKRQAYRLAIFVKSPSAYALASKTAKDNPALESRAWRAAELVAEGMVKLDVPGVLAQVEGSDEAGAYNIVIADGQFACDCQDWTGFTAPPLSEGQRVCKHLLAYFFSGGNGQ